ncbi:MAG: NAD-dependent epimerase/dehydratase family protein [Nocardioidaceae bacterium]
MNRAVVTGGAGFLGSWACEALLDTGAAVVCVDSELTGSAGNVRHLRERPGFSYVRADISTELPVDDPVDLVLHLASPASPVHYLRWPLETLRVGSLGTFNALDLAARNGARFVLASTSEVYGDPLEHPQTEGYWGNVNPVGPRSVYDEAKRFSEAATAAHRRAADVDTGIVRIFNTYGPRMAIDDGRVVPTFIAQCLRGEPLTVAGDGSQTRSLCYVTDTVAGLLAMAAADHPGPVNIGNPHEVTMLELAELVRAATGSQSPLRHVELPEDDPRVRCPDITLAHQILGWAPRVAVGDGLARTIAWCVEQLQPR